MYCYQIALIHGLILPGRPTSSWNWTIWPRKEADNDSTTRHWYQGSRIIDGYRFLCLQTPRDHPEWHVHPCSRRLQLKIDRSHSVGGRHAKSWQ
jgi:hypothetical protein